MSSFDVIQYNGAKPPTTTTATPYDTRKLSQWDNSNAAPAPAADGKTGYDVVATRYNARRRAGAYHHANGNLCDNSFWWPMFVSDVTIDIALSGTMGQSRTTRDFYPHNFVQPQFTVQGQALDQQDYAQLVEFVHQAQYNAIAHNGPLLQLYINGAGWNNQRAGAKGVTLNGKSYPNLKTRGVHSAIVCQGWIPRMPRKHSRGVYAPTYSFPFIVAVMIAGPYQEDMVQVMEQQDWLAVVQSTQTLTGTPALVKQNTKVLNWAKSHSDNIFNTNA